MKLDLTSLIKSVSSLQEALEEYKKRDNSVFVRDSCIQRFEYTYELSHKMLKRYLKMSNPSSATFDEMSFQDLIRTGCDKSLLLSDWKKWKRFRDIRNLTSHTYDKDKAEEVFAIIPEFLTEADIYLINCKRNHSMLQINDEDLEIVLAILKKYVPDSIVKAFGSRVKGTARKFSDLDLVVIARNTLTAEKMADLRYAFEESDLPFKVDIIDWSSISTDFKKVIEERFILLQ